MFGIGLPELLVILVIALIVLGPEKMPQLARDVGRTVGDLRRTSDELREEFLNADRMLEAAEGRSKDQVGKAAKTEPAKAHPAKTEPAKAEPAKTEAAKAEPAKTEPEKAEPAKTEPEKSEADRAGEGPPAA